MPSNHSQLRIGIDLDNTIVCYDPLFAELARQRQLGAGGVPLSRVDLRDHLRRSGREDLWTELQGEAYGVRMEEATPFPGALAFVEECARRRVPTFVISHRTRFPHRGPETDLHAAAQGWLERRGFARRGALSSAAIFLEMTREDKLRRIASLRCTHFIDDLPDVLGDPAFPRGTSPILFDPEDRMAASPFQRLRSWTEGLRLLLAERT